MTTRQAYLDAITAHPDDDTPRLAYADWLDGQGDSDRAEFIRCQCDFGMLNEDDPDWKRTKKRIDELLALHGRRWAEEVGCLTASRIHFSRGFIGHRTVAAHDYIRFGRTWPAKTPLRSVELRPVACRA